MPTELNSVWVPPLQSNRMSQDLLRGWCPFGALQGTEPIVWGSTRRYDYLEELSQGKELHSFCDALEARVGPLQTLWRNVFPLPTAHGCLNIPQVVMISDDPTKFCGLACCFDALHILAEAADVAMGTLAI